MGKMTDAELEAFLRDGSSEKMTDAEIEGHLNEDQEDGIADNSMLMDAARAATQSLPVIGSIAGGVIAGGPTLGAAALGGSALGAMAGKAAQTLIEENLLGEKPKPLEEKITELPKEAAYDVAGNLIGGGIVGPVVGMFKKPLTKVASAFSGVPEQAIKTYAKNFDEVRAIDDVMLEADRIRESASRAIKSFEGTQNKIISQDIANRAQIPVDTTDVINFLEQKASSRSKTINPDIVNEINQQKEVLKKISVFDDVSGRYYAPAKDAAEMKQKLQDLAQYEEIGKKFNRKDYAGYTMTGAARELRKEVNKVLPEYAQANLELAKLRRVEEKINRNLITPEKSIAAMTSVGSGTNPAMEKQVQKLGDITNVDLLTRMQNLAAAQKLGNADILSGMTTGRATIPLLTSSMASAAGGIPAGIASGLMTTPIGIKTSIQAGKAMQKIGLTPSRLSSEAIQAASPYIMEKMQSSPDRTPQGQADVASVMQTMHPYDREQYIKKDNSLTPTQKAVLLKQNRNDR